MGTNLNRSARALMDAIRSAELTTPDTVPPDWMTLAQLMRDLDMPETSVRRRLKVVPHEVKLFKVRTGAIVRSVPHYRLSASH
jgi:hypothetical protein